jgi:peptidoglycan/xylan/chitin deacetylase (PgdA/CDA1 family)
VVILTYHRVTDARFDPQSLAVSPARFAEHVAEFSSRYELMSIGDVVRALVARRRLPRRGLVITFDDGYADALESAYPILRAAGAPATLFIATGCLDAGREFWWDELEQLLLFGPLPEALHLPEREGGVRSVRIPAEERDEPAGDTLRRITAWNVTQPADGVREQLYAETTTVMLSAPPLIRAELLGALRAQTGEQTTVRADKRTLDRDGVAELARDGLVEIGAHTVNHVWLSSLPREEQREEIADSKRALESILDRDVASFSYPYGSTASFTPETERIVKEAGFLGAVTTDLGRPLPWGSVSFDSDRYALSRMPTADVPASDLVPLIDRRLGL